MVRTVIITDMLWSKGTVSIYGNRHAIILLIFCQPPIAIWKFEYNAIQAYNEIYDI